MQKRYIHTFRGFGDHGYGHVGVSKAFDGILEALKFLIEKHGQDWVDEKIEWLATGDSDGNIAWASDTLGYCITTNRDI